MNASKFHFWNGLLLTLSVTPLWPFSLALLVYVYAKKHPIPILRLPKIWIIILTTIILSITIPSIINFVADTHRTSMVLDVVSTIFRWSILVFVGIVLLQFRVYNKFEFWFGVFIVICLHSGIVLAQQFLPLPFLDAYPSRGFSNNSSLAGYFGAIMMVSPVSTFAGITLGFSLSRSYVLATFLIALYFRNWKLVLCALTAVGLILLLSPTRISPPGIIESFEARNALNPFVNDISWKWYGMGFWQYNEVTGLQAPHNIWILSWYELGIFSVLLWGMVSFVIVKFRAFHFIPLLVAGLFTPELYDRPETNAGLIMYHFGVLDYVKNRKVS